MRSVDFGRTILGAMVLFKIQPLRFASASGVELGATAVRSMVMGFHEGLIIKHVLQKWGEEPGEAPICFVLRRRRRVCLTHSLIGIRGV
jgi:hypothetical protein